MDRAHTVDIIHPSNNLDIDNYSPPNLILDTQFLAMELASQEYDDNIIGR